MQVITDYIYKIDTANFHTFNMQAPPVKMAIIATVRGGEKLCLDRFMSSLKKIQK